MPYLGNPPAEAYTSTVKDSFSGDGSTTAFTLSQPSTTNDLRVVVENVIQDPTVAYSVSGTTLTFTSAPPTGTNNIYAVNLGPAVQTVTPPAEIGNATTFNSSVTVQGAFTSPGIDDNATSTAMTLDSNGNLLVGKTADDVTVVGTQINDDGFIGVTRSGNIPALFNRTTSDGDIVSFRKDGSTVGSVGATSGVLTVGNATTGGVIFGYNAGHTYIEPSNTSGASTDDLATLGSGSKRFRDLYLSGGVYLGGTGSANKLEDYEEGTWTPTISSGTITVGLATYTKIGQLVVANIANFGCSDTTSGTAVQIGGLPYTSKGGNFSAVGTFLGQYRDDSTAVSSYVGPSTTTIRLYHNSRTGGFSNLSFAQMFNNASNASYFSIAYETNS